MNRELKELQDQFVLIDLMTKEVNSGLMEVLLKKMLPLEFRMEPDKHAPHIHISYGNEKHTASYLINNGERVAGNLKNKYDKIVKNWIEKNQDKLMKIWNKLKAGNQNKYELLIGQLLS